MKILNQSLQWLDQWEHMVEQGLIDEKEFLTKNTAESLRITLKSTIDLVMYLLKECDFKYVLTSKLNQDSLEVSYLIIKNFTIKYITFCFFYIIEIFWNY